MWNAGYDDGEYQNGYGYNDDFQSRQEDNQYSSYYQQPPYQMSYQSTGYQEPYFTTPQQPPYQQDSCSDYYQPPSFHQSYFQQSEEYHPPQPQCQQNDEMAELRAMMQEYMEFHQQVMASSDTPLAELKASWSTNTIAPQGNTLDMNQEWSREDRAEVLSNDIEVEVVDEDVNEEGDAENDLETDWLPLEAAPNDDSTCLDSFEDGIDVDNEYDTLMYELIMGNGLTSEQGERLVELTQAIAAPVSKTEITESEPQSIEHMHHSEPSLSPTYVDLGLERSEEAVQIPSVDQASVELSNEKEQELPNTQTVAVEHSVGKSLVWGKTEIFPFTDKGENGGYMSGVVVKGAACDPESKGRYLGRSYGGFRDQFYIGPCSDVSGVRSRKEYHGPWFND